MVREPVPKRYVEMRRDRFAIPDRYGTVDEPVANQLRTTCEPVDKSVAAQGFLIFWFWELSGFLVLGAGGGRNNKKQESKWRPSGSPSQFCLFKTKTT